MRLRVTIPTVDKERLRARIIEGAEKVESEYDGEEDWVVVSILYIVG
jgi:ribosome maturation protein SDO1